MSLNVCLDKAGWFRFMLEMTCTVVYDHPQVDLFASAQNSWLTASN